MRWHLPIRRRYLHSYRFPLARVHCDVSLRANIHRISRDDQPLLAAINCRFLRRVRQRDLSFAGQEGYVSASQGNLFSYRSNPEAFINQMLRNPYCTTGALCKPPLNFAGMIA